MVYKAAVQRDIYHRYLFLPMNETRNTVLDSSTARLLSPDTQISRQIPCPANAVDLCSRLYRNETIREIADLTHAEFKQMTVRSIHI